MLDVGAIFGSMALGYLSDLTYGKRSPVALLAVIIASFIAFSLKLYIIQMHIGVLFTSMFFLGFFISGLNNLISSACAADLGKQEVLKGNERAISTVTGIIDGTGTLGSAIGQFIVGVTQKKYGWYNGYLLVVAITVSVTALPILKIAYDEIRELRKIRYAEKVLGLQK
jgi:MFS transporter, OPA family, solute carrier family 37 (glycerol-3-phosphate transporter), member 3